MHISFDSRQGLIIVRAELWGPTGSGVMRLALDTGATSTVVNVGMLVAIGYDPALAADRVQVTTGSGIEFAPRVIVEKIVALGDVRADFPNLELDFLPWHSEPQATNHEQRATSHEPRTTIHVPRT